MLFILAFTLASLLGALAEPSLEVEGPFDVSGSEYLLPHSQEWSEAKAVEFTVTPRVLGGSPLSKDHGGFGTGGHLTFFVGEDGVISNRFQDASSSKVLESESGLAKVDESFTILFTMESFGTRLYVNNIIVATNDFVNDISGNTQKATVGASMAQSSPGLANNLSERFNGVVSNIRLYSEVPEVVTGPAPEIRESTSVVVISKQGQEPVALLSAGTSTFRPKVSEVGMRFLSNAPTNKFNILGSTNLFAETDDWDVLATNLIVKTEKVIVIDNRVSVPWVITNSVYTTNNIVVDGNTNVVTATNLVIGTNMNYFYKIVLPEG